MAIKKKTEVKTDWQGTIILWGSVIALAFGAKYFFASNYYAFKCDYRSAVFGPNSFKNLQEFGGDPCVKKGKNRFKIYYAREFKSKSDCENFINTASERTLRAPSSQYLLGCDKK